MPSIVGQKEVMGAIVTYKYSVLRSGASTEGEQRRELCIPSHDHEVKYVKGPRARG